MKQGEQKRGDSYGLLGIQMLADEGLKKASKKGLLNEGGKDDDRQNGEAQI